MIKNYVVMCLVFIAFNFCTFAGLPPAPTGAVRPVAPKTVTRAEVDVAIEDLKEALKKLDQSFKDLNKPKKSLRSLRKRAKKA